MRSQFHRYLCFWSGAAFDVRRRASRPPRPVCDSGRPGIGEEEWTIRKPDESWTAFADRLARLEDGRIDLGIIHSADAVADFHPVLDDGRFEYAESLMAAGVIRAIGLSRHNPTVAEMAAGSAF